MYQNVTCLTWYKILQNSLNFANDVRFEVFTAVTMKNAVLWDVTVCTSQETHYVSATEPGRLMLCKIWGFTVVTEECRLLGCYAMWLLRIRVLMECITSIIRVTWIGELGTVLAVTSNRRMLLTVQVIRSFEMLVLTKATQHNIPEDCILLC
jgi:hypothetical protein